ncbi:peptide-binding protein [Thermotalea metallivorans]|uniref:Oligopeptide-binding protein AppA n=1 Tax=Thermotalea metallivorans TaxID=520762 RepID=A0A140KZQ5_9FIRM|nr:peptide-binding protein [Thermotalea metallivorans]KXG73780.1 Oligopeptide-binding protein AppA [Thermotalea metallivorans]
MKRLFSAVLSFIVFAGLFTACTEPSSNQNNSGKELNKSQIEILQAANPEKLPQAAKDRKDTLIVGTTAPQGTFNPIYSGSVYDSRVCSLIFDGLINNDAEGNPIPHAAEKWDISQDGKTYTFYIKKGIKFSDGKELTAEDVAFTFTAMCDPNYDGPRTDAVMYLEGYEEYNKDKENKVKEVKGIKVIDPYTIQFTLTEAQAPAIWNFGYGILPKHYYGFEKGNIQKLKDLFLKPMGSGAYVLKNYKAGQEVVFEKNPDYWKGAPKIKTIVMKVTNANTVVQELTAGNVDIDAVGKPEMVELIKQAGFLDIYSYPANSYGYIGLNLRDEKFKDKKVRQALMYGLDRKGFINAYYKGNGQVCNAPVSPVSWAYTDEINTYEYNPDLANKLLDEAGWVKGEDGFRYKDGEKFTIHWMTYTGSKYVESLIPILKDNWGKLGIEVIPELMEFGTLAEKVYDKREFEMYNMAWSLAIDPDPSGIFAFAQDVPGGNNSVGWRNEEAENLMKRGLSEFNQEKRKEIYKQWLKIANDDLPYLFLGYNKDNVAVSCRVKGVNPSPYIDWTYDIQNVEIIDIE